MALAIRCKDYPKNLSVTGACSRYALSCDESLERERVNRWLQDQFGAGRAGSSKQVRLSLS